MARARERAILWHIGGETFECERLYKPCPLCGAIEITALPPPIAATQPDDTTHVCLGCNHGFSVPAKKEPSHT